MSSDGLPTKVRPRADRARSVQGEAESTGVDALLTGEIAAIGVAPAAFNRAAAGDALRDHARRQDRVQRPQDRQGALVESRPWRSPSSTTRLARRRRRRRPKRVPRPERQRDGTPGIGVCAERWSARSWSRSDRDDEPRRLHTACPQADRTQATLDPIYCIVGDDDAEMSHLAAELSGLVEDELRAFNVERIYATDKSSTAAAIVEAAHARCR